MTQRMQTETLAKFLDSVSSTLTSRGEGYDGESERSMEKVIKIFNTFHGTNLTVQQGWHFMMILKQVRMFSTENFTTKFDSLTDCTAYTALLTEQYLTETTMTDAVDEDEDEETEY